MLIQYYVTIYIFTFRANDADDIMLSGTEIKQLALDIEDELFKYYGGVTSKYKNKYRSLVFNMKDPKNKV